MGPSATMPPVIRVLLADDDPATTLALPRLIKRAGSALGLEVNVITAMDGYEALNLTMTSKPPIHLLMLDGQMPKIPGWDIAKELTHWQHRNTLVIAAISAGEWPEELERYIDKKSSKPLRILDVQILLEAVIAKLSNGNGIGTTPRRPTSGGNGNGAPQGKRELT